MAKEKKAKKEKKDKNQGAAANSLAGTPGVSAAIARTRSRWALGGMVLAAAVAYGAGSSTWWIIAWAIIGGVGASLTAWWVSVMLWRMALTAEYTGRQREAFELSQVEIEE